MAKTYDAMAAAVKVKRGTMKIADVPEKHQGAVNRFLTRDEPKMIQHMRAEGARSNFRGQPIHVRSVRSA